MSELPSNDRELLRKIATDLYYGNGKPGLTTRLLMVENAIETIKFYARWLLVFVAGILVTAVVNLIVKR